MKQGRFITVFAGIAAIVMLLVSMVMPQTAMASAVGDAWVHKVTYNAATPTVTYLHSSIVRKINVTDPMADDGLLSIDDVYADEITSTYKTVAGVATIPMRSVYVAGSWVPIYIQNPGTEWRAEADREHRLRYQTARSPLATSPVTTNYIGMRNYSPSTFGQNYTLGETWSYTEQVDSSNDIGDSTVTVNVTVAGATESVTVPAGTFTCYKVVRQYPGANPNGLDNTVTEWWEVDTAEHFCHAPIKTVDNHNFRYSQTSELNSKTLTTAGMCGWPDEDPPDPCAYDFDGDGYNICQECDDSDPNVNPGALELCDGIDNDCDGLIDEGVKIVFYRDADADGYGSVSSGTATAACSAPSGYVTDSTDCDDTNPNVNPGATEICGNGVDDNCNGFLDDAEPTGCVPELPVILVAGFGILVLGGFVWFRRTRKAKTAAQ